MRLDELQAWLAAQIAALPELAGIPVLQDDGDFAGLAGREAALRASTVPGEKRGLAVTVIMPETAGVADQDRSTAALDVLLVLVVEENVPVNRGAGGFGKPAPRVVQDLMDGLLGKTPPGTFCPLSLAQDPVLNFGKVNGVLRMALVFQYQHVVTAA